jgi:hypothetical protein
MVMWLAEAAIRVSVSVASQMHVGLGLH